MVEIPHKGQRMRALKILFIGGTGNISLPVSQRVLNQGHELWLLNRTGQASELPGARFIAGDINEPEALRARLQRHQWDAVVNWVGFTEAHAKRDVALFRDHTAQYVFISSASCYQKPARSAVITEDTPLENPYWQYSRDKIAAERYLMTQFETNGFPATVVRPSHTYSRVIPLTIGGWTQYTTIARMKLGMPVVVQGDGEALWTLTHARDFAIGFCGLLGQRAAVGEAFHITSDAYLSWNRIYQLTAEALGIDARIVHVASDKICALDPSYTGTLLGDKSVSAIFDNSKIKRFVPEFNASTPYAQGIREVLAWFEADTSRQIIDLDTNAFIEKLVSL